MGDEEFEGMSVVALFHLLGAFPSCFGFVFENKMLVVILRLRVFDPEVPAGDFSVGQTGVFFNGLGVSPGTSDIEEAGGGFHIAFPFEGSSGGRTMNASSPSRAGSAQT